jgi:hypothetical protein
VKKDTGDRLALRVTLSEKAGASQHPVEALGQLAKGDLCPQSFELMWKSVRFAFTPGAGASRFQKSTNSFDAVTPSKTAGGV